MRTKCGTILAAAVAAVTQPICAAAEMAGKGLETRDPAKVWNLQRLCETPRVREWPKEFKGGATPVMIEGEPYQGRETWCFAYYGTPEWASSANKAPAIVLVHGGLGTAYPEWVRMWVRRGYAAICVDTCGALPVRTAEGKWLANPEGGPRGWAGSIADSGRPERDQWVYHAVAAVMRSHSFIRSLDCVDSRNIGVTGISWGGFLTCILAAADDRFAYAVPVYGCGFNYERPQWLKGYDERVMLQWARLWDASCYLPFAKCPMMWVDGTNDFAFSLDRVRRSAALAPVEHVFSTHLRMVHGHGEPGEGPREILAFADHFAKGGADVVRFGECKLDGNCFTVKFDANGRKIVRAELLYTLDGMDVKWDKRLWRFAEADTLDVEAGVVSAALPTGAFAWIVNLVTDDGLVFSTPYRETK